MNRTVMKAILILAAEVVTAATLVSAQDVAADAALKRRSSTVLQAFVVKRCAASGIVALEGGWW
jgi:hypothetical protein